MTVFIKIDGKRILADIPWDGGRGPKQAKEVPGFRGEWDKTGPKDRFLGWTYPLTLDSCHALRRVFGSDLVVSNDLANWARNEIQKQQELEEFREDNVNEYTLARLPEEAPHLYLAMMSRSYQIAGVAFLATAKRAILGDEPGLGKTLQALGAIIENDAKRILVICPKSAMDSVWRRETDRWAPSISTFVAQGTRAERDEAMGCFSDHAVAQFEGARKMLIVNPEMIRSRREEVCPEGLDPDYCNSRPREARGDHRHSYNSDPNWPFIHDVEWDAIIFDESHNVLASTANYQSKRISLWRFGAVQLRKNITPNGLAIALSGTPFRSDLTKGWGTLNWLEPKIFTSYWNWAGIHFGVEEDYAGHKIVGDGSNTPEPIDPVVFDRMLRPYYLARKKAEVVPDLPPIIYAGTPPSDNPDGPCYVRLDMDPKQAKAYHQMADDAEADISGGRILATGILAETTRLRQFATSYGRIVNTGTVKKVVPELPSNKIDWIVEFMLQRKGRDGKVVIASNFTEVVELTASVLRKEEWEVLTLTGATSSKNRAILQQRFQDEADPLRVVGLNTKAGGEAITLDRADEMIVIDDPWKSDTSKQLHDRIHRVSRMHQVTIYRLISNGTIEEWLADLTDEQRRVLENATPMKLSELMKEALK